VGKENDNRSKARETCAATVPFTNPDLLGARVRGDRWHDLVALLRDFARNGSTYVIPWHALPASVPLGRYDTALHGRIGEARATSPAAIQQAGQDAIASGAAGSVAQADEISRRAGERRRRASILAILAGRLLAEIGLPTRLADWDLSRKQLEAACLRQGLRPERLTERVEQFADTIMPVGLDDVVGPATMGPVRIATGQLNLVASHFEVRAQGIHEADRYNYLLAARTALEAGRRASGMLAAIDQVLGHIVPSLAAWDACCTEITSGITRLNNILDGWETIFAFHTGVIDAPTGATGSKAAILASLLPGVSNANLFSVNAPKSVQLIKCLG